MIENVREKIIFKNKFKNWILLKKKIEMYCFFLEYHIKIQNNTNDNIFDIFYSYNGYRKMHDIDIYINNLRLVRIKEININLKDILDNLLKEDNEIYDILEFFLKNTLS